MLSRIGFDLNSGNAEIAMESEIHGTTLRVYWYLFRNAKPVGVRETQRALSMSSPSTALYHLEKLRELGVTEKDEIGQYFLKEQVQVGTLRMFLRIGRLILPRYLFYAIFLTTAVAVYAVERIIQMGTLEPAAVVFGAAGAGISWYECARLWRERLT
jgi:DNA-binding transcriptional ArsR family regulator